jgi:hypothetical protein
MQEMVELEAPQVRPPPPASSLTSPAATPSGLATPSVPSPAATPSGLAQSSSNLSSTAAEEPERKRRRSGQGGEAPEEAEHCSQCHVSLSTRKIRFGSEYYTVVYSANYSAVQHAVH